MSDPFAQPQKLLNWAYAAHQTAHRLVAEFFAGAKHHLVTEEEADTG